MYFRKRKEFFSWACFLPQWSTLLQQVANFLGKTLRMECSSFCLALMTIKVFQKVPAGLVCEYFWPWQMGFMAVLPRKKQLDNYECSCFLGPEHGGHRWAQSHFLKQFIHQKSRLVAAELAVSTATCRHSALRSLQKCSHFPPQGSVLTQWVPAQQIHLWQEVKP